MFSIKRMIFSFKCSTYFLFCLFCHWWFMSSRIAHFHMSLFRNATSISSNSQIVSVTSVNPCLVNKYTFHVVHFFFIFTEHQPFFTEVLCTIFLYSTSDEDTTSHVSIINIVCFMSSNVHLSIGKISYFVYSIISHRLASIC